MYHDKASVSLYLLNISANIWLPMYGMCDISFQTGDEIKVTSQVDADWVVGELRGKKGMFPTSFVDKVPEDLPSQDSGDKEKSESPSKSSGNGVQPSFQATATKKKV